ncbi:MAG: hypothetical protein H0U44_02175 [Flavisolibacter sp.]|nr:hypothetical protein [Flavisolibacter sp.]
MLFEPSHINLGNYESFIILYMDNELNPDQVQMVEAFLALHPDLRTEFDLLMETKLEAEPAAFDKSALFSFNMKSSHAEEELLLFVDNELSADRKKIVELELQANPVYQEQFQLLKKSKLDAAESLAYPNKKELYHHQSTRIQMAVWMRVAAILILMASLTILFLANKQQTTGTPGVVAIEPTKIIEPGNEVKDLVLPVFDEEQTAAANDLPSGEYEKAQREEKEMPVIMEVSDHVQQVVQNNIPETERPYQTIEAQRTSSIHLPKHSFNTVAVTPAVAEPYNQITASIQPAVIVEDVAVNNKDNNKGSLKGFFRKATRFVEKTTGIDPTNGEDELLIGVVALKLK